MCEVCHFRVGTTSYCPDCVTAGPSVDERSSVFSGGLLSVGFAVAGFGILIAIFVLGALGVDLTAWDVLITLVWLACSLVGIGTGLIAREGARRTGSVLPTIGVTANGLLIALQVLFIFLGSGGS